MSTGSLGPSEVMDYTITVPVSMALALSGVYTDITVEGSQGEITAETVQGEVKVTGGSGFVSPRRSRTAATRRDRKSTRLNSSHVRTSYAVFCLKNNKVFAPSLTIAERSASCTAH